MTIEGPDEYLPKGEADHPRTRQTGSQSGYS
jgi:hypothetical protein